MKPLAQIGYEAYAESCGGKAFNGDDLPTFDNLRPAIREHWEKAADAIRDECLDRARQIARGAFDTRHEVKVDVTNMGSVEPEFLVVRGRDGHE